MATNKTLKIAIRDLRKCYSDGILAGLRNFDNYWARDSFFSSFGSLALKDYNVVKKNLELFLKYEKNGQLALRIDNYYFYSLKFLGIKIKGKFKARYKEDKLHHIPKDQNSLFIINLNEYIKATKDYKFLRKNYYKVKKIIDWNGKDLIKEESYSGWADSIKRKGYVLYTNVLHCKALYDFYKLSKDKEYLRLHNKIKDKINKKFWNGKYYVDFLGSNYLATDGNILGILFNIFPKNRIKKVINSIEEKRTGFISLAYPQYKRSLVFFPFHFLNMYDYHNMIWLWLDSLYALILYKNNFKKKSLELMNKISDLIIKYDNVYEIYERNEDKKKKEYAPVSRFFYKSEVPFAWSAGIFIYTVKEMKLIKQL